MSKEDMSGLDETFNTVEAVGEVIPPKNKLHLKKPVEGDDVIKDYEYARGNLYSLIAVSYTHLTLPTTPYV